jgi:hypothetical protein
MAFNAEDNWEFPAAYVVAAKGAVEIGPNHVAPAKANPGAILQAAVFQREIRALWALLQTPGVAAAAAAAAAGLPAPQGNPQVPRPPHLVTRKKQLPRTVPTSRLPAGTTFNS